MLDCLKSVNFWFTAPILWSIEDKAQNSQFARKSTIIPPPECHFLAVLLLLYADDTLVQCGWGFLLNDKVSNAEEMYVSAICQENSDAK